MKAIAVSMLDWWSHSWRLTAYGFDPTDHPAIIAMWHDEMLPVWIFCAQQLPAVTALVSPSRDGQYLSQLLRRWGYEIVYGSAAHDGKTALERLTQQAATRTIILTPDGSRGPRHRMKAGAVVLAYRTQRPLRLCRIQAAGWRFTKSWDHFLLPYPFTTIELFFSPPITIPKTATRQDITRWIHQCEQWLNLPANQLPRCCDVRITGT